MVDGLGYSCQAREYRIVTYRGIFNELRTERSFEDFSLTPTQCKFLVETQMCNKNQMTCDNEGCSYTGAPDVRYWFLTHTTYRRLNCFIKPIRIQATEIDGVVFYGKKGPCHPLY
jgi:hypothetical protein